MQLSQLDLDGTYTHADYSTWQCEGSLGLIKAKIMLMSPALNVALKSIFSTFNRNFVSVFKHKECRLFAAPFDV